MGYVNEDIKDREEAILEGLENNETIVQKTEQDVKDVERESKERAEKLKQEGI